MKSIRLAIALSAAVVAVAPSAQAQLRRSTNTGTYGTYPGNSGTPAGMCRVWINGLPANQQPGPTDCATARANAPANSRIIYGSNTTGTYDPRRDPRSAQYDPRYGQYGQPGQYGAQQYPGQRGRGNADWKAQKEREKAARKQEKEREKAARKQGWNGNNRDDHGNYDERNDHRGDGTYSNRGTTSGSCIDANRDGVCDYRQQGQRAPGSIRFP
ncbi:MAG TPA: hypothetical protein VGG84_13740 [Gemmatimonadaceae bacterium]